VTSEGSRRSPRVRKAAQECQAATKLHRAPWHRPRVALSKDPAALQMLAHLRDGIEVRSGYPFGLPAPPLSGGYVFF